MKPSAVLIPASLFLSLALALPASAQTAAQTAATAQPAAAGDPVASLVGQLDLERYKETIRGLARFGDRRQGTERNRKAIDWIEAQLKSFGCATERIRYDYAPPAPRPKGAPRPAGTGGGRGGPSGQGGSTLFGTRAPTSVNEDPLAQPDERLRRLNAEQPDPKGGPREEVYCTKVGSSHPDEMYILSAHMDGMGYGEAANDDASGTALVMELARILNAPGVRTERSIRFALWNNEETGLNGAAAYVAQRNGLQGIESPKGSGRYPEPRWLGMVQHDMMMFDHGMPVAHLDANGKTVTAPPPEQRREADVNIEFQANSRQAEGAQKLAWAFRAANDKYASDYPASVGPHMTNTDSTPFMDLVPAISLRENERGQQIGAGWNPHWHQPTDLVSTFSDKDYLLGLNAAQTTLAAIAQLAGAKFQK
ncbi:MULTISPECIES: M20/M25/M40 family metallo-hydrolase [unclassified Massilia]|uniref:M20/M25/M40 family metallo-hydrolase n=1 Tax=unclassified Massilia TaxID=2609279 RepID=UPI000B037D1D|nr:MULTISPECIES: M20/M25/M40 family metallo-hydrolase [unclassified Massilia]